MPANNPPLRRSVSTSNINKKKENEVIKKGYDTEKDKMKNFSTVLSESEHRIIDDVIEALNKEAQKSGMTASKRMVVRRWIIERAESEAKKLGLIK